MTRFRENRRLAVAFAAGVLFAATLATLPAWALSCNNCVDGSDIVDGAVKGADIGNGAVTTNDLKDGTIKEADLASTVLRGYWRNEDFLALPSNSSTETEIVTQSLPSGNWILAASVTVNNDDTDERAWVDCRLRNETSAAEITRGTTVLGLDDNSATSVEAGSISMNAAIVLSATTTIALRCSNVTSSDDVFIDEASVTAIKVKSVTITET